MSHKQITLQNIHTNIQQAIQYASLQQAEEIIEFLLTLNYLQIDNIKEDAKNIYHFAVEQQIVRKGTDKCIAYLQRLLHIDPLDKKAQELFISCHIHLIASASDIEILKQVLIVQPCDHRLQYILGNMYSKINDTNKALEHLKLALGLVNDDEFKVKILYSLSELYYSNNDMYLCRYYLLEAYKINPNHPDINNLLGIIYNSMGLVDKAIEHFERATIYSVKTSAVIYMNLGTAYTHKNDYKTAIAYFDKALEHDPNLLPALQNKLFNSHYILHTLEDPMYLTNLHKTVNKFYPSVITNYKEYTIKKDILNWNCDKKALKTKLKIGFISGEFIYNGMCGVVSYFMASLIEHIDYDIFDIICYSLKPISDAQQIYPKACWKFVRQTSTEELKSIIRSDGVDILFDLATHTGEDRLDVFSLKAAPIQISYCGYPNTSGLASMDYHITDKYCDSDGITPGPGYIIRPSTQKYYSEKLIFMDHCFLNYTPCMQKLPDIFEQPVVKNGYLTLGCFNKFNKINESVIAVWERILESCPTLRLIVKCKEFRTPSMKIQFLDMWKNKELQKRITTLDYCDTNIDHLLEYNNIDIALDTFPYSGTCTTCDALLMGVPVVTLFDSVKQQHVQNVSSSIMANSKLSEFICLSAEQYVNKVKHYANNMHQLNGIKAVVRQLFLDNICNYKRFVDEFEDKMLQVYKEHPW